MSITVALAGLLASDVHAGKERRWFAGGILVFVGLSLAGEGALWEAWYRLV